MKLRKLLALVAFSAAAPLAFAQSAPIASTSLPEGADQGIAGTIAQALNADTSLQNTKITVAPNDDGSILLTGSTATQAQLKRAGEIAAQSAGEGKVVNVIIADEGAKAAPQSPPVETIDATELQINEIPASEAPAKATSP